MLTLRAHAKLTLSFEVLGGRGDGYHEVAGVFQSINLADRLTASPAAAVHLRCSQPDLSGPANLAWQAADLLRLEAGVSFGALLELDKSIPTAAGLGGGSADAAAALLLLNRFWELNLPEERLEQLARRLGSDVPFALTGGTALVKGRGNDVTRLPPLEQAWFVLLHPPLVVEQKTAYLYHLLQPEHYTDGRRASALAQILSKGGAIEPSLLGNVFDAVVDRAFPGLEAFRDALRGVGAQSVHLCGAGPTLFALAPSADLATRWANDLKEQGYEAYKVSTAGGGIVFQQ
jgi:4-diphosphocytidyl-2-C-methyl-D-erythritol kinase